MPVNFEWDRDLEEWDWSSAEGLESLEGPSEEFWKKFEELPDLGDNLETLFAEVTGQGPAADVVVRNHDCMWAGVCHSKECHKNNDNSSTLVHQSTVKKGPSAVQVEKPAAVMVVKSPMKTSSLPQVRHMEKKRTVIVQKNRSLLVNRMPSSEPMVVRPDTPQSMGSESEEEQVLPASQVTGQHIRLVKSLPLATDVNIVCELRVREHDHDYEKKKVMRPDDLGVQTPSDSEEEEEQAEQEDDEVDDEEQEEEEEEEEEEGEDGEETGSGSDVDEDEEIDVVSVGTTRPTPLKPLGRTPRSLWQGSGYGGYTAQPAGRSQLPTNPSTQFQHHLQETVADSLLTASRAVSRRLQGSVKRKRCSSLRSEGMTSTGRGRRRLPPAKKSRYSSNSTGYLVDTEKRSLHNNMERMRRIDLRNAFEDLRLLVPSIADTQKAAKVTILKDATHYVKELNFKDRNLCLQIDALRSEQDRLRRTLSHLRRILAYKNIAN